MGGSKDVRMALRYPKSVISLAIQSGILILVSACVSTPTHKNPNRLEAPDAAKAYRVEPPARSMFLPAERAYLAKNFEVAESGFLKVKKRFPARSIAHMLASYRLGSIYYGTGRYEAAANEFKKFLEIHPKSELAFDATYNLAASEYQMGKLDRAYGTLSTLPMAQVQAQGPRRAEVVFSLAALVAGEMNNYAGAVAAQAALLQIPMADSRRESLAEQLDANLARVSSAEDLKRLMNDVNEPTTRQKITARLAALEPVAPTPTAMPVDPALLNAPVSPIPGVPGLVSSGSGSYNHVGVILPLTGKSAAYGQKALEGILLAARHYSHGESPIELHIEDSASNPLLAQQAVDTLFYKYRVMGILGPLGWKESLAVAERSQELGVLNLSFTGKSGLSEKGAYLFQNALTPSVQLESLVRHCILERKFRRFAILAPNNSFGEDMANEFWDLVEKYSGRVVGFELYAPDENDFQVHVRKLTGLDEPQYRRLETIELNKYIAAQKTKTGREPKTRLPAIVDFDGIFVPDSPKTVAQVAASLAYFDATGPKLLGTTEWNTDQFYKRGGRHVEGALFPGGISVSSHNPRQRDFIRGFAEAYGSAPDLLASQGFEALTMIAVAMAQSRSSDRNQLVREMSSLKGLDTPLGTVTIDATRVARRMLPVFQLEAGGNIIEQ